MMWTKKDRFDTFSFFLSFLPVAWFRVAMVNHLKEQSTQIVISGTSQQNSFAAFC